MEIGMVSSLDAGAALEAVTRGEIDIQIATAKRFPRSITAFKRQAEELATLDEATAATMFYRLPRGRKTIEGPSVRMAEVVAYAWGNLRVDARIAGEGETTVTAVGTAFDLERNVAVRSEVTRRITDSNGVRYNVDMIAVTKNAACSIAFREAVFKAVPRALYLEVVEQAKLAAIGKAKTMEERRDAAFGWFVKAGVDPARVLAHLGRKGLQDVTVDDLVTLTGYKTAIKDGELQIDEAFPLAGEPSDAASAAETRLRDAASRRRAKGQAPPVNDELDRAGLTGDVVSTPGQDPDVDDTAEMARFFALLDDTRADGRKPSAPDGDRAKLLLVAKGLWDTGVNRAGDQLEALAADPQLSAAQSRMLLQAAARVNVGPEHEVAG